MSSPTGSSCSQPLSHCTRRLVGSPGRSQGGGRLSRVPATRLYLGSLSPCFRRRLRCREVQATRERKWTGKGRLPVRFSGSFSQTWTSQTFRPKPLSPAPSLFFSTELPNVWHTPHSPPLCLSSISPIRISASRALGLEPLLLTVIPEHRTAPSAYRCSVNIF